MVQGFFAGKLAKRWGDEKLLILGILVVIFGFFILPFIPNVVSFLVSTTFWSFGFAVMLIVIPSFISKRSKVDEQGEMLGIVQSVESFARIPGPLIGGFALGVAGLGSPFFLSGFLVFIALILSYRILKTSVPEKTSLQNNS